MDIDQAYRIFNLKSEASDEEIVRTYKKLAMRFHPDRNRERPEWANKTMSELNNAYSDIMAFRFRRSSGNETADQGTTDEERFSDFRDDAGKNRKPPSGRAASVKRRPGRDELIDRFARIKDASNSVLYKFFQYSLYNMARRDTPANEIIFKRIVKTLRNGYHACVSFEEMTDDPELKEHFRVFREMLYNFYLASECVNRIDSYMSRYNVDAYREYRKGDEYLHRAHREIFYDRHNRGSFKGAFAMGELIRAESVLSDTLKRYRNSSWAVEAGIKLNYAAALREYLNLFFTE